MVTAYTVPSNSARFQSRAGSSRKRATALRMRRSAMPLPSDSAVRRAENSRTAATLQFLGHFLHEAPHPRRRMYAGLREKVRARGGAEAAVKFREPRRLVVEREYRRTAQRGIVRIGVWSPRIDEHDAVVDERQALTADLEEAVGAANLKQRMRMRMGVRGFKSHHRPHFLIKAKATILAPN